MPTPVFLTGATGFIGQAAVPTLLGAGHQVRALVRDPARLPPIVEPVAGDLATFPDWGPALQGVETVVHLAARAHILRDHAADPLCEFRRVNRDATLRLAEGAAAAGVRRFVFLSSIGVLGERTGASPFGPSSRAAPTAPYAVSKWEAEEGLRALAARTGMEVVVIRPPLVHGPGAPGNFARLLRLVASGVPLPFAAVQGRRTFVGRANLCSLILAAMTHPDAPRAPLFAGDRESLTLPELLRVLAAGMGRPARLYPLPGLALAGRLPVVGGPVRKLTDSLVVDTSETSARLGWTPVESAEAGLASMARAWRETR